jgi:hypothetical protein
MYALHAGHRRNHRRNSDNQELLSHRPQTRRVPELFASFVLCNPKITRGSKRILAHTDWWPTQVTIVGGPLPAVSICKPKHMRESTVLDAFEHFEALEV